ncbi:hypothetical protein AB84_0357 [Escherichia coli 2-052-05_S3_C1]|nr:hypothetical protein AB84_0357 [Escherichia coli 2-052-05_S3_C1]
MPILVFYRQQISHLQALALWGTLLLCFIQARGMLGLDRVV